MNGRKAEDYVYNKLLGNKNVAVLGRQVYVRTPGAGRGRYVDILAQNKTTGQLIAVEVKSGRAARSAAQLAKDKIITSGGGAFFGMSAARAGVEERLTKDVLVSVTKIPLWKIP